MWALIARARPSGGRAVAVIVDDGSCRKDPKTATASGRWGLHGGRHQDDPLEGQRGGLPAVSVRAKVNPVRRAQVRRKVKIPAIRVADDRLTATKPAALAANIPGLGGSGPRSPMTRREENAPSSTSSSEQATTSGPPSSSAPEQPSAYSHDVAHTVSGDSGVVHPVIPFRVSCVQAARRRPASRAREISSGALKRPRGRGAALLCSDGVQARFGEPVQPILELL